MATRLNYALPIAKQFLLGTVRRLRPGGLAGTLPPSTRDRPFVIVTGAGRSGTSATSRVLHESGVRLGSDFDPGDKDNATGYYQERAVYETNGRMLAEMGMSTIEGSYGWPWRSTVLAIAERFSEELATIARSDTDGWKDPIFSTTLEAWLPHLPARPKIVVCLRSPRSYAESVARIYGLVDVSALERQWAKRYRRLLDVIRDYELEAHCVEYSALLSHPKETVAALAEFVGCELKPEYVKAELQRFASPVPAEYQALYDEVLQLGKPA